MLTVDQITHLRDRVIATKPGTLILHAQDPGNYYHWSKTVCEIKREDWLDLINLALSAANLRAELQTKT